VTKPNFLSKNIVKILIKSVNTEGVSFKDDMLAAEEPLEIVIAFGENKNRRRQSISVTMRTPTGNDFELALGFLFTEGVIGSYYDVISVRYTASELDEAAQTNVVQVDLHPSVTFDEGKLQRHFYTSSSCGVCGKTSMDMVQTTSCFLLNKNFPIIESTILFDLPTKLLAEQSVFEETGGIHAAALFDTEGVLITLREDVGRHNALDKLIGWAMQQNLLPLSNKILLVSGRSSFELVQKAIMAGIPILAAVGAPSSLAVQLADENELTVVGFLKNNRFNIYSGFERIRVLGA
jgi:FdhD protein